MLDESWLCSWEWTRCYELEIFCSVNCPATWTGWAIDLVTAPLTKPALAAGDPASLCCVPPEDELNPWLGDFYFCTFTRDCYPELLLLCCWETTWSK